MRRVRAACACGVCVRRVRAAWACGAGAATGEGAGTGNVLRANLQVHRPPALTLPPPPAPTLASRALPQLPPPSPRVGVLFPPLPRRLPGCSSLCGRAYVVMGAVPCLHLGPHPAHNAHHVRSARPPRLLARPPARPARPLVHHQPERRCLQGRRVPPLTDCVPSDARKTNRGGVGWVGSVRRSNFSVRYCGRGGEEPARLRFEISL